LMRDPHVPTWLGREWCQLLSAMLAREANARPTASEVAARAHELLDIAVRFDDTPGDTEALDLPDIVSTGSTEPSGPERLGFRAAATVEYPVGASAGHTDLETTGSIVPRSIRRPSRRTRALIIAALAIVGIALAALLVFALMAISPSATSTPQPTPSIPVLPEPLSSDVQDLLNGVSE
jgi:hypothetical protein